MSDAELTKCTEKVGKKEKNGRFTSLKDNELLKIVVNTNSREARKKPLNGWLRQLQVIQSTVYAICPG